MLLFVVIFNTTQRYKQIFSTPEVLILYVLISMTYTKIIMGKYNFLFLWGDLIDLIICHLEWQILSVILQQDLSLKRTECHLRELTSKAHNTCEQFKVKLSAYHSPFSLLSCLSFLSIFCLYAPFQTCSFSKKHSQLDEILKKYI